MREPLLADEDATYREEEEVDFLPVDEMSPGVRRGRPPLSGASSAGRLGGAVVAPNSAPLATTGRGAGFTRSLTDSEDSSNLGGGGSGALALLEGGSPPLRQSRSKRWGQRGRRSARRKDGVQPGSSSPLPDLASRRSPSPYMGGSRTVSTPSPKSAFSVRASDCRACAGSDRQLLYCDALQRLIRKCRQGRQIRQRIRRHVHRMYLKAGSK